MMELYNEEHVVTLRPSRDESDHFDVKCPGCKHSAYLSTAEDNKIMTVPASSLQPGDEVFMVCPQPEGCEFSDTFTVRNEEAKA